MRSQIRRCVLFGLVWFCAVSPGLSQAQDKSSLKTYPLHNNPNAADISPTGNLVATEITVRRDKTSVGTNGFVEEVQLWAFEEDKLVKEARLEEWDAPHELASNPVKGLRFVRFTPDGKLIVALFDHAIHILRTTDLAELKRISITGPGYSTHAVDGRMVLDNAIVKAMELSPKGDVVALLWAKSYFGSGTVQIYDLASGEQARSWDTPQGWFDFSNETGLAWNRTSDSLLVAAPLDDDCSLGSHPDVFVFDVHTGTITRQLRTGLRVGDIAVTSDNRLLAVSNCVGLLTNHHPQLRAFDLSTGKRLADISDRSSGVRYLVSASPNGDRVLAFTGRMKAKFDWLDFVSFDTIVDETFSVWRLKDNKEIMTSHSIKGLKSSKIRLGPNGRFAVSYGTASNVYELP